MDDFADDDFAPQGLEAQPGEQAAKADLRNEILDLLAQSSMPTLQLAIERLDEAGSSVTLSVPGADPRLAEGLFHYMAQGPSDSGDLIEGVRTRHAHLAESYNRAYDLASRRKLAAAVHAFNQYFAEVPSENDPKAAADRARLLNTLAARGRRRKKIRVTVASVLSASVVLAVLAFAGITWSTWGMAASHLEAKEWHAAVAAADRIDRLPAWLRFLIPGPWRSTVRDIGEEARGHIRRTEKRLEEAKDAEAAERSEAALSLLLALRQDDSPDYRARIAASLARLSRQAESALTDYLKDGKLGALTKLLETLASAPELVAESERTRAAAALEKAIELQAERLEQARAASERRDWKSVLDLHLQARHSDRESFLETTREIVKLADTARAKAEQAEGLARRIRTALAAKAYETATEAIPQYEAISPEGDPRLVKWRKQIADAEKERDVPAAKPAPVWTASWRDATKALAGREYSEALGALGQAAKADPERQGKLAIPVPGEEPEAVTLTADQARRGIQRVRQFLERTAEELGEHLTKGDKGAARASALAILRLDPHNWAGRTPRAAMAYAELQLADDYVRLDGGPFLMGATPALRTKLFEDGVIKDIGEITDATAFEVTLPPFFMAVRLVSVADFCAFLSAAPPAKLADLLDVGPESGVLFQAGKYSLAEGKAELPITRVSWVGATAYCAWLQTELHKRLDEAGAHVRLICRLPTEAEWEFAASGREKKLYPGFQGPNDDPKDQAPRSVRTRIDVSPFGCCDMSSNVRQWVSDWYAPYPTNRQDNYLGPEQGQKRVVRGGSFEKGIGLSFRRWKEPEGQKLPDVGFRVVVRLLPRPQPLLRGIRQ